MHPSANAKKLVVGLGVTGLSCARYLDLRGEAFKVTDSRLEPPGLDQFMADFPSIEIELGGFREETFVSASEIIVSPGVSLKTPQLAAAIAAGVPITGDIDIFSKTVEAPIQNEGAIQFGVPGDDYPMTKNPPPCRIYQPRNGDLILFPSSLFHRTIPVIKDVERCVIAFDLIVGGQDKKVTKLPH